MQNNFFLSRSKLEESNKTSFIIFGAIHEFLEILQVCRQIKPKETLTISLDTPGSGHTRQPKADRWAPWASAPPRPGQGSAPALTRPGARPRRTCGATRARTCGDGGGGTRRRGEGRPERAGESAHGDAEVAVRLTGGGAGEERQQRGGAMSRGGGGWRRAPAALRGGREGRVRGEIERGKRVCNGPGF